MKYALTANHDGSTRRLKVSDAAHELDADQIECSVEQYDAYLSLQVVNGTIVAAPPAALLAQAKVAKIQQINAACEGALCQITQSYPASEVSTWPQQLSEAIAFTASAAALTPMLSAIAAGSGKTVGALAASINGAAAAYQAASGAAVGRRQLLTAQVNAAASVAAVQAVAW